MSNVIYVGYRLVLSYLKISHMIQTQKTRQRIRLMSYPLLFVITVPQLVRNSSEMQSKEVIAISKKVERSRIKTNPIHPSISVKFLSWKDSNDILNTIIKNNNDKDTNIFVAQQFSKHTTDHRNNALKLRKSLLKQNKEMEYKLLYPATLVGRQKDSSQKFKIVEEF